MNKRTKIIIFITLAVVVFILFAIASFGFGSGGDQSSRPQDDQSLDSEPMSVPEWNPDDYGTAKIMYQYKRDGSSNDAFTLLLSDNASFVLRHPHISLYSCYGSYVENEGVLTLSTTDGKYVFVFNVLKNGDLVYNAEESVLNVGTSFPLSDGSLFR